MNDERLGNLHYTPSIIHEIYILVQYILEEKWANSYILLRGILRKFFCYEFFTFTFVVFNHKRYIIIYSNEIVIRLKVQLSDILYVHWVTFAYYKLPL